VNIDQGGWIGWLIPKGSGTMDIDVNKETSEEEYQKNVKKFDINFLFIERNTSLCARTAFSIMGVI